jgi:hypothetical protein
MTTFERLILFGTLGLVLGHILSPFMDEAWYALRRWWRSR